MTIFTKSDDGTRIAYETVGTGPPVILVDGAMCHRSMRPLASLLSTQFTVCSYDRRGRGESGDTLPYAIQREIEDLEALIEELGGSAYVYGISSGAVLTIKAAVFLGNKIKKLALYEPPFTLDKAGREAAQAYTQSLNERLSNARYGEAVEQFMKYAGMPSEAIAGMRQSPMWPAVEAIAPTLAYDNAIMGDSTIPKSQVQEVPQSTLVMTGGNSPEGIQEVAHTLSSLIPSSRLHILENQTHDVEAEAIAPYLESFFRETL